MRATLPESAPLQRLPGVVLAAHSELTPVPPTGEETLTLEKITADVIELETMSAEHMHKIIDANRKGPKLMAGVGAIAADATATEQSSEPDVTSIPAPGLEAAEG